MVEILLETKIINQSPFNWTGQLILYILKVWCFFLKMEREVWISDLQQRQNQLWDHTAYCHRYGTALFAKGREGKGVDFCYIKREEVKHQYTESHRDLPSPIKKININGFHTTTYIPVYLGVVKCP